MKKIASIGMVAVDIITNPAPALPAIGQCKRVDTIKMYVGGNAANSALDLAKLGVPVRLACRIGGDSLGRFVHGSLTATVSIPKASPSMRRRKPLPPLSVWIRLKRTGAASFPPNPTTFSVPMTSRMNFSLPLILSFLPESAS